MEIVDDLKRSLRSELANAGDFEALKNKMGTIEENIADNNALIDTLEQRLSDTNAIIEDKL